MNKAYDVLMDIDLNKASIRINRNASEDYITVLNQKGVYVCAEYGKGFYFNDDFYELGEDSFKTFSEVIKRKI